MPYLWEAVPSSSPRNFKSSRLWHQPNKLVLIILEVVVLTPGAKVGGKFGNPEQLELDNTFSPATGAPCPHCLRHNHPPQPPAENRRVLRAFLADYGPTLGLGGMDQAAPDLPGGSDDSGSAEDEQHNAS